EESEECAVLRLQREPHPALSCPSCSRNLSDTPASHPTLAPARTTSAEEVARLGGSTPQLARRSGSVRGRFTGCSPSRRGHRPPGRVAPDRVGTARLAHDRYGWCRRRCCR